MSTIDITMKKIYGLNKYDSEFKFKSETKHNFVYGVNAIGKTSISKGLELLSTNRSYKKLMDTDSDDYLINFKFDNLTELMDSNSQYTPNSNELSKRLFIFTKRYLNQNISLVNADNSNIQIGIKIAEREKYINEIDALIDDVQKEIFDKIKIAKLKNTKEYFGDNSSIIKLKSTSKDKAKERFLKQQAFEELVRNVSNQLEIDKELLTLSDFNGKNLKIMVYLKEVLQKIVDEFDTIVKENINDELYKINNIEDKEFYNFVIQYLKNNKELNNCPTCKNSKFDTNEIISRIESSLAKLLSEEIISALDEHYSKLEQDTNSNLFNSITAIYNNLLKKEIDIDNIKHTISVIDDLNNRYDYYLLKYIDFDLTSIPKAHYDEKLSLIKQINEQNNEYSENDLFIEKLNQMLEYIFDDNELRAEKFEYTENGNKYYGIQLIVNGVMKKGISIEDFWAEILSESQKTKISLAFMFSVIIFNDYNGKILCIFDDPIDSYDSINKYKMSRVIYEFIEKKNIFENCNYDCYDIIFSHSVEYLRLFKDNLNVIDDIKVSYWVMSTKEIASIKKEHLFLLSGDYNILNKIILDCKNNNSSLNINNFISLTPIIRELSSVSRKVFDSGNDKLNIKNNNINDLDKYISENVIHGYSKNKKINEIISYIKTFVDINIDNNPNDEGIFDYIKNYLDLNINNLDQMDFYEQIFFKNIMSLYIRAKYDYELCLIIQRYVSNYNNKTLEEIHDKFREISKKMAIIYKDNNAKNKSIDLLRKVSKAKPMINDFAHSANIFLTPLIDVTLKELKQIYDNL